MFLVDTHCDTLLALAKPQNEFHQGLCHVTPELLRQGDVSLQVCALFSGSYGPEATGDESPQAHAEAELAQLHRLTEGGIRQVDSPFDVKEGEHCLMLSIEGGEIIGSDLSLLTTYRKKGVRLFTLTWNFINEIGYPHCKGGHHRLKPFGWDVVRELARLGIAADVAHLGEGGFWDLIEHADKAPMTSHSCCRKLCNHTRNLTDDQLRALIERSGWVGINFYTRFLSDNNQADLQTVVRHIQHIADLGGIANVGFGSDFDGIESAPVGLENAGCYPQLLTALQQGGFSQAEIEGIAGGNFLNYMRAFEPKR